MNSRHPYTALAFATAIFFALMLYASGMFLWQTALGDFDRACEWALLAFPSLLAARYYSRWMVDFTTTEPQ